MSGRDDDALAYLSVPSGGAGRPVLIVHSWWGLTSSFTRIADQLASRGFLVGCADLFDGATAATEAKARRLRQMKRRTPAYKLLQRSIQRLAADARSTGTVPAVIGFSMGAHWTVWLAQHPDPPISGAVLFYGARGGDFSKATAPLMAHFAETDAFVSASARRSMERAVNKRGLEYTAFDYPRTTHWFAESAHPAFSRTATRRALERTTEFLSALDMR